VLAFLTSSTALPAADRVAVFDNDGTLWCEQPQYVQLGFFLHELAAAVAQDPVLGDRPEYTAALAWDTAALGALGIERVGLALAELFAGQTPEAFAERVRAYVEAAEHPTLSRRWRDAVYQPMRELLDALAAHGFSNFIVTGGGTEFVRAISWDLYRVPPERVVGTHIGYEYVAGDDGPALLRTATLSGEVNEGPAKVRLIQQHVGRRPAFAAGNSAGDAEMLRWTSTGVGPSLSLVVEHDDAEREFAYRGAEASTGRSLEMRDVAQREGWTVVSMRDDWGTVFPS
jgi:hypothetical protein